MATRPMGDGKDLAAAWDDLRAAIEQNPGWSLESGFYRTNGGSWGCKLTRPNGSYLWVAVDDDATVANVLSRAARYVRGELVEYVNDRPMVAALKGGAR